MIKCNFGFLCSRKCQRLYGEARADKISEILKQERILKAYIDNRGRKKYSNPDSIKTRKRAAKDACHEYIRERDKYKNCICCGYPLGDDFHAGHFLESYNNPKIRYDEDNIHGQRIRCNYYMGGDSGMYRVNLITRIGLDRVERLESLKGGHLKRTVDDYRKIEQYYKEKLKQLKDDRKI